MSPLSREDQIVWSDLAKKASTDMHTALKTPLDLAAMIGGAGAMTSVMLHVTGTNMSSLATLLACTRDQEQGSDPRRSDAIPADDFLLCCLFVAAGFLLPTDPGSIPRAAIEMFRKLTGRDPDLPLSWTVATGAPT
jgi:hypothetical protein